jgi:hypothetical protein
MGRDQDLSIENDFRPCSITAAALAPTVGRDQDEQMAFKRR